MSKFVPSKGDWTCPDLKCGNINFAKRFQCNKCGAARPKDESADKCAIGKSAAEKSRGLFSAEDWSCRSCGNVNWARRDTCNICNTPRVNTLGERSGYGGGFMEREEVVEYKRHRDEDSDGEYDEFGRKKKKYRLKDSQDNGHKIRPPQVKKASSEEEEDEEDGDDGDLSKYNIWGSDNDDDSEKTISNKDNIKKSSRSRSLSSSSSSSSTASKRSTERRSRSPVSNRRTSHH